MGRDLHRDLITFFEKKISTHTKVAGFQRVDAPEDGYYIYRVKRRGLPDLNVLLADEYIFTQSELLSLPEQIKSGDIVYIADPNAGASSDAIYEAKQMQIFIGKFGELFGALNSLTPWTYTPPKKDRKTG